MAVLVIAACGELDPATEPANDPPGLPGGPDDTPPGAPAAPGPGGTGTTSGASTTLEALVVSLPPEVGEAASIVKLAGTG